MADIKPSSHGIVVDHTESKVRYAVSDKNFNPKVNEYVRDLKPGESVHSFKPKRIGDLVEAAPVEVEDYSDKEWTVDNLLSEIDQRNEQLDEDNQITPDSGKKADLIAALMLDDEAQIEDDSTPE